MPARILSSAPRCCRGTSTCTRVSRGRAGGILRYARGQPYAATGRRPGVLLRMPQRRPLNGYAVKILLELSV